MGTPSPFGSSWAGYSPLGLGSPSHTYIRPKSNPSTSTSTSNHQPSSTSTPTSNSISNRLSTSASNSRLSNSTIAQRPSAYDQFDEAEWINDLGGRIRQVLNSSKGESGKYRLARGRRISVNSSIFTASPSKNQVGGFEGDDSIDLNPGPSSRVSRSPSIDQDPEGKGKGRQLSDQEWLEKAQREYEEKQEAKGRERERKKMEGRVEVSTQTVQPQGTTQQLTDESFQVGNTFDFNMDGNGEGGSLRRPVIEEIDPNQERKESSTQATGASAVKQDSSSRTKEKSDPSVERAHLAAKAVEEFLSGGGIQDKDHQPLNISEAFLGVDQDPNSSKISKSQDSEDQPQSGNLAEGHIKPTFQIPISQPKSQEPSAPSFVFDPIIAFSQLQASTSSQSQPSTRETLGADPIGPSQLFRQIQEANGGVLDIEKVLMSRQGLSREQAEIDGDELIDYDEDEDEVEGDSRAKMIAEIHNNAMFGNPDGDVEELEDDSDEEEEVKGEVYEISDSEEEEGGQIVSKVSNQEAKPHPDSVFDEEEEQILALDDEAEEVAEGEEEEEEDVEYDTDGNEIEIDYEEEGEPQGPWDHHSHFQQGSNPDQPPRGSKKEDAIVLDDSDDENEAPPTPPKRQVQSQPSLPFRSQAPFQPQSGSQQRFPSFSNPSREQEVIVASQDDEEESQEELEFDDEEEEKPVNEDEDRYQEDEDWENGGREMGGSSNWQQDAEGQEAPMLPPPPPPPAFLPSTNPIDDLEMKKEDQIGDPARNEGNENGDSSFEIIEPPSHQDRNEAEILSSSQAETLLLGNPEQHRNGATNQEEALSLPTGPTYNVSDEKVGGEALVALGVGVPLNETNSSALRSTSGNGSSLQKESTSASAPTSAPPVSASHPAEAQTAPAGTGQALLALKAVVGETTPKSPVGSLVSNKGVSPTGSLVGKSSKEDLVMDQSSVPPPLPIDTNPMIQSGEELSEMKESLRGDQMKTPAESERSLAGSQKAQSLRTEVKEDGSPSKAQASSTSSGSQRHLQGDLAPIPPALQNPIASTGADLLEIKEANNESQSLISPEGSQKSVAGSFKQPGTPLKQEIERATSEAEQEEQSEEGGSPLNQESSGPPPFMANDPIVHQYSSDPPVAPLESQAEGVEQGLDLEDEIFDDFVDSGEQLEKDVSKRVEAMEDEVQAQIEEKVADSEKSEAQDAGMEASVVDVEPQIEAPTNKESMNEQSSPPTLEREEESTPPQELGNVSVEENQEENEIFFRQIADGAQDSISNTNELEDKIVVEVGPVEEIEEIEDGINPSSPNSLPQLEQKESTPALETPASSSSRLPSSNTPRRSTRTRSVTSRSPKPTDSSLNPSSDSTQTISKGHMDGSETIPEAPEESEESEEEPDSEGEEQLLLLPTQASQLSQRVTNSQPSLASNSSLEGSQSQESSINRVSDNQPFPELSSGPFQEAESSSRKNPSKQQGAESAAIPRQRPTTHHHHHGKTMLMRAPSSSSATSMADDPKSGEVVPEKVEKEIEQESYKIPETRSKCSYHVIRLASLPSAPTFLAPGCSLQRAELKEEGADDVRTATSRDMRNSEEFDVQDLSAEVRHILSRIVGLQMVSEVLLLPSRVGPKITEVGREEEGKDEEMEGRNEKMGNQEDKNDEENSAKTEEESAVVRRPHSQSPVSARSFLITAKSPKKTPKALPSSHRKSNPFSDVADYTPEKDPSTTQTKGKGRNKGKGKRSRSASRNLEHEGDYSIEGFEHEAISQSQGADGDTESMPIESPIEPPTKKSRRSTAKLQKQEKEELPAEVEDEAGSSSATQQISKRTRSRGAQEEMKQTNVEETARNRTPSGTGEGRKKKRKKDDEVKSDGEEEQEAGSSRKEKTSKGKGKEKEKSPPSTKAGGSSSTSKAKRAKSNPTPSRSKTDGDGDSRMDLEMTPSRSQSQQSQSQGSTSRKASKKTRNSKK